MLTKNIKIIITDDSPEFIEGLQVMLFESPNHQIIGILNNGEELLRFPRLQEADIILMDLEMPLLGGIEAAKQLKIMHPGIPAIALTMYSEKVYLKEIIEAGFKAYIYKPEVANKLFDIIEKVLNNKLDFQDNINRQS